MTKNASSSCDNLIVALYGRLKYVLTEANATLSETNPTLSIESLLEHGQNVANILREWGAGEELQQAALIHSLLRNCDISPEEVRTLCGERVLFLSQTYQEMREQMPESRWRGKPHELEQVKYFILAHRDLDLALLGAADLWCHYRSSRSSGSKNNSSQSNSSKSNPLVNQSKYAEIARHVLSPYLEFLGMYQIREELEEWLVATRKQQIRKQMDLYEANSRVAFNQIRKQITPAISWAQLLFRKRFYSSKPSVDNISFSSSALSFKSQPVLYIDVLVDNEELCYRTLFWLHRLFTPVEDGVNDSIGNSRRNGYRTLQTIVWGDIDDSPELTADALQNGIDANSQGATENSSSISALSTKSTRDKPSPSSLRIRIHFEICTYEMDEINRWGVAAVHLGKSQQPNLPNAWWTHIEEKFRQIDVAPIGSLAETLYVFSPQGELFRFHRGCTVVDYAYYVHSELAAQCRRFFINGETVEPATVLHHLDLIELEHDPSAPGPTRVWFNAARTPRAKTHIDRYLKRHGQGIYHAQKALDVRRKALEDHYGFNIPDHRVSQALSTEMQKRSITSLDDLMNEISAGRLNPDRLFHPFFADEIIRQVQIPTSMRLRPHQLNLAQCCKPKPGDDIIGRPSIRNEVVTGLKIHRLDCAKLGGNTDGSHPIKWRLQPELKSIAQIEMRVLDEHGILGDAVNQIYAMLPRVTLYKAEAIARNGVATIRFVVEAASSELIDEITDALRRLPNRTVDEVRQMSLPLSEREDLLQPVSTAQANPYSRMPVFDEGMFFGRSKELSEVRDWLRAHVGIIWLLGQKRVGKTSLLLHLKNHFLDKQEFTPVYLDFQMLSSLETGEIFFEIANAVYSELRDEGYTAELGSPLHTMFEHDPSGHLVRYLRGAQSHPETGKLVLLLDEFSRTTDAHQQGKLDESFFQLWRGLVQSTQPYVKYVIVVQQQAYDSMVERVQGGVEDPSWRLMELGEKMPLLPLTDKDARHLIEWPIRNYLEFSSELLDYVYSLTGGSPFLIQSFCFRLVSYMIQINKRQVDWPEISHVEMEFMSPNESLFAHLLDLIRGVANAVCSQVALLADAQRQDDRSIHPIVDWAQIKGAHPNIPPARLHSTLNQLCERHILIQVEEDKWCFGSLLFQDWLALNSMS
ncbi:MAG: HD domain-containing protein [Chloroflexota bacterium]